MEEIKKNAPLWERVDKEDMQLSQELFEKYQEEI